MTDDIFGRSITATNADGFDIYAVSGSGAEFVVSFPEGTSDSDVMHTINSMAPKGYAPQPPSAVATKRQILLWLYLNLGKTDTDVQSAIKTIPDPVASELAMITWLNPDGPFQRSNPLFDELAPIFGLKSAQVDAAFVAASSL